MELLEKQPKCLTRWINILQSKFEKVWWQHLTLQWATASVSCCMKGVLLDVIRVAMAVAKSADHSKPHLGMHYDPLCKSAPTKKRQQASKAYWIELVHPEQAGPSIGAPHGNRHQVYLSAAYTHTNLKRRTVYGRVQGFICWLCQPMLSQLINLSRHVLGTQLMQQLPAIGPQSLSWKQTWWAKTQLCQLQALRGRWGGSWRYQRRPKTPIDKPANAYWCQCDAVSQSYICGMCIDCRLCVTCSSCKASCSVWVWHSSIALKTWFRCG